MISRIVDCNIKPDKLNEFRKTLNTEVLPKIARQDGFVDVIECIDTKTGHFLCTTLWETMQDVESYDKGLFQEVAQRLVPLLRDQPQVHTMVVETSTPHAINAGRSMAA
jgi:quinol monooxygenase YgiN